MRRAVIACLALAACARPSAAAHGELDALDAQLADGNVHAGVDLVSGAGR